LPGPKKVSKERAFLAVAGIFSREPEDEIAAVKRDLPRIFVWPGRRSEHSALGRGRILAAPPLLSLVSGENPKTENRHPSFAFAGCGSFDFDFHRRKNGLPVRRKTKPGLKPLPAGRGGAPRRMPTVFSGPAAVNLPWPPMTRPPQGSHFCLLFVGLDKK
jgi:hypothetical protein